MKKAWIVLTVICTVCLALPAHAIVRSNDVGIGIVLGEPSGLVGQFFMSQNSLLDVTLAWSLTAKEK